MEVVGSSPASPTQRLDANVVAINLPQTVDATNLAACAEHVNDRVALRRLL